MNVLRGEQVGPSYAPERERAYHLAILAGAEGSVWVASDMTSGTPLAMAWGPDMDPLEHGRLPKAPATVSFIAQPEWSTLVPDGALEPGTEAAHLALVHGDVAAGELRDEPIGDVEATCIYKQHGPTANAVLKRYPNARPLSMRGLMVRAVLARWRDKPVVLVHRGPQRTDLAIADRGRLLLSNSFPVRTANDLLYFTLNAVERSGLRPDDCRLFVGGTHLMDTDRELLERYFAATCDAIGDDERIAGPDPLPHPGRWLGALEQFACVS